eukprot:9658485-Ditylum_brightwellii.AAC.1
MTAIPLADHKIVIPLARKSKFIPLTEDKVLALLLDSNSVPCSNIFPINKVKRNAGEHQDDVLMLEADEERNAIVNEVVHEEIQHDQKMNEDENNDGLREMNKVKKFELDM